MAPSCGYGERAVYLGTLLFDHDVQHGAGDDLHAVIGDTIAHVEVGVGVTNSHQNLVYNLGQT